MRLAASRRANLVSTPSLDKPPIPRSPAFYSRNGEENLTSASPPTVSHGNYGVDGGVVKNPPLVARFAFRSAIVYSETRFNPARIKLAQFPPIKLGTSIERRGLHKGNGGIGTLNTWTREGKKEEILIFLSAFVDQRFRLIRLDIVASPRYVRQSRRLEEIDRRCPLVPA